MCHVSLLTEKYSHGLTVSTPGEWKNLFWSRRSNQVHSPATKIPKEQHFQSRSFVSGQRSPDGHWLCSQRLFCYVNYCRTDLWHRTTDLEWDLEHWITFCIQETRAQNTLAMFHCQKSALSQLKAPTVSLCLVCYSSFPSWTKCTGNWSAKKNHLWSLSARRFSLNASWIDSIHHFCLVN